MAAFKQASNLMVRFIDGRGDAEALLPGVDPLAFAMRPRTGPPLEPGRARADATRAIDLLRGVMDSAAGTDLAEEARGPLAVMELFTQAHDLDFSGPMVAQVESVLGDAVRLMPESSQRDLADGLCAVVDNAGDAERPDLLAGSVDVLGLIAVQGFSATALDHAPSSWRCRPGRRT